MNSEKHDLHTVVATYVWKYGTYFLAQLYLQSDQLYLIKHIKLLHSKLCSYCENYFWSIKKKSKDPSSDKN